MKMTLLEIFSQNIAEGPGVENTTSHLIEIVIMLLVAFILGYLIRMVITSKYKSRSKELSYELESLRKKQAVGLDESRTVSSLETKMVLLEQKNNDLRVQLSAIDTTKVKSEGLITRNAELEMEVRKLKQQQAPPPIAKVVKAASSQEVVSSTANAPRKIDETQLKRIEGIGPKIQEILHAGGILTFSDLAKANTTDISNILLAEGPQYKVHDPGTWPEQAAMARDGRWDELTKWQNTLKGGKKN